MTLKPTKDWILTQVVEVEEKNDSPIIQLKNPKAETVKVVKIVSFGPDSNKSSLLKEGDRVMVLSHTGVKHKSGDDEFEFAKEHNFLGIVE